MNKHILSIAIMFVFSRDAFPQYVIKKSHSQSHIGVTVGTAPVAEKTELPRRLEICSLPDDTANMPPSYRTDPKILSYWTEARRVSVPLADIVYKYNSIASGERAIRMGGEYNSLKPLYDQAEKICKRVNEMKALQATREPELRRIEAVKAANAAMVEKTKPVEKK